MIPATAPFFLPAVVPPAAMAPEWGDDPLPPAAQSRPVLRVRGGMAVAALDDVLDEVPVALVYNGVSHAVMMATPADLEDFALGFSLSEGILAHARQCHGIEVEAVDEGLAVHLEVATPAFLALKERRRSLAGRTGCGLCGVDSLRAARRPARPVGPARALDPDAVARALSAIGPAQPLARLTGAAHAVAWCRPDGTLDLVREDVGRHNALDKIVGALARAGREVDEGFVLMTSRVSLEMVQKAMMAGIAAVVGISAPTLAAVQLAQAAGMTLLGFAREGGFVCYANGEGIAWR